MLALVKSLAKICHFPPILLSLTLMLLLRAQCERLQKLIDSFHDFLFSHVSARNMILQVQRNYKSARNYLLLLSKANGEKMHDSRKVNLIRYLTDIFSHREFNFGKIYVHGYYSVILKICN